MDHSKSTNTSNNNKNTVSDDDDDHNQTPIQCSRHKIDGMDTDEQTNCNQMLVAFEMANCNLQANNDNNYDMLMLQSFKHVAQRPHDDDDDNGNEILDDDEHYHNDDNNNSSMTMSSMVEQEQSDDNEDNGDEDGEDNDQKMMRKHVETFIEQIINESICRVINRRQSDGSDSDHDLHSNENQNIVVENDDHDDYDGGIGGGGEEFDDYNNQSSSEIDLDDDEEEDEVVDDDDDDEMISATNNSSSGNSRKNNRKRNNRNKRPSQQQPQSSAKTTTTTNLTTSNHSGKQQQQQQLSTTPSSKTATTKTSKSSTNSTNCSVKSSKSSKPESSLAAVVVEPKSTDNNNNNSNQNSPSNSTSSNSNIDESPSKSSSNKMNGIKSYGSSHLNGLNESNLCKICTKNVYHMEQIKAVKATFHKSCFRCVECNKQLNVDSYSSNEGLIYCKPHFKQLSQPKPNFDNNNHPQSTNGRSNGLEDSTITSTSSPTLSNSNNNRKECDGGDEESEVCKPKNSNNNDDELVGSQQSNEDEEAGRNRSDSLTQQPKRKYELIICENQPQELPPDVVRYDSKQEDIFENLSLDLSNIRNRFENGSSLKDLSSETRRSFSSDKPIARSESIHKIMQKYQSRVAGDNCVGSSSDEEDNNLANNNESSTIQHHNTDEKVSFSGMSTLKSQWETGSINANAKMDSSGVENELAELRKKVKSSEPLKQVYERAIQEAKSTENLSNKSETVVLVDGSVKAGSIKERFEKGALETETEEDRMERMKKEREAEITQIASNDAALKEARNKFKQIDANVGKEQPLMTNGGGDNNNSNGHLIEDESIDSEQLQQRFNYFENFNGNAKDDVDNASTVKIVDDIPKVDTTKKMLSKFKALEAGQVNGHGDIIQNGGANGGPKLPKSITPPRETGPKVYENEPLVERDPNIVKSSYKTEDVIQVEPEKAKHLRAKFENWQTEIERENRKNNQEDENDFVPLERDSTKNLRAMFESKQNEPKTVEKPRPRVNRFVDKAYLQSELCYVCSIKIYPMEKMEFSGIKLHKNCFRCTKCHMPLRLDNFTQHADRLFCIPHFKQLFMEKGNYDEGFGLEQHKDKWSNKSASTLSVNGTTVNGVAKSAPVTPAHVKTNGIHNDDHDDHNQGNHVGVAYSDEALDSLEDHRENYYEPNGGGNSLELEDY